MRLKGKHIILLVVVLVFIAIAWTPSLTIREIESGNRIVLSNGVEVRLIGVGDTDTGEKFLKQYVNEDIKGIVPYGELAMDIKEIPAGNIIYGYVYVGNICLNEAMLKEGCAPLLADAYLDDKNLDYYKSIAKMKPEDIVVEPNPKLAESEYAKDNIINLPEYVPSAERKFEHFTNDAQENLNILRDACDYNLSYTRTFATQLAGRAQGNFSIEQVCEIFDYCLSRWKYVNDPKGQEYVARASESIASSLTGDCDDFAVVITSCCLAVGGNARIVLAYGPQGGHAYSQVDINSFRNVNKNEILRVIKSRFPYSISGLNIKHDGQHAWLNLDWQDPYPGGSDFISNRRNYYACINGVWEYQGCENY